MAECVRWIEHKGKRIILLDVASQDTEEQVKCIKRLAEVVIEADKFQIPCLIDVRKTITDEYVLAAAQDTSKKIIPYVSKTAIIGITGIKRYFLKIVITLSGLDIRPFTSEEKAKDWLVRD